MSDDVPDRTKNVTQVLRPSLADMVGTWRVSMSTTPRGGPTTHADGLQAEKRWSGGGRYVREEIAGAFGSEQHEKLTMLGYNVTRDQFEYMTADNHDGVILLFTTSPGSAGDGHSVTMFTEYAMPPEHGDEPVFLTVKTVIAIESHDRHTIINSYIYAGGVEQPFLEYVYTRAG